MSIKNFIQKPAFKIATFVFLAVALAFAIGYMTGYDNSRPDIVIEKVGA